MSIVDGYELVRMVGDPDDHRPATRWAPLADPGNDHGRVDSLVAIVEHIGVGDRIPTHVHRIDEVIFVHGPGRQRLGEEEHPVDDGAVVFVPAGVAHGLANTGAVPLRIDAVFASDRVWIRYVDRNPAPGTQGDPPRSPFTIVVRTGELVPDAEA